MALSRILKGLGVDLVDVSTGGLIGNHRVIPLSPGYQVKFGAKVRHEAGIPTASVGLITEVQQAETIVREGQADLIFQARESLRDPYFPYRAAQVLGVQEFVKNPPQYARRNVAKL